MLDIISHAYALIGWTDGDYTSDWIVIALCLLVYVVFIFRMLFIEKYLVFR